MQHTPTISKFAALALALALTGCARQESAGDAQAANAGGGNVQGQGILSSFRPKADPTMVERLRQEDAAKMQQAALAQQQMNQQMNEMDGTGRILPKVSMEPIAPPAEEVATAGAGMSVTAADSGAYTPSTSGAVPQSSPGGTPPATASYGGYNSVPSPPATGSLGGGLVPPPPAVTLSTAAQTTVASAPPGDPGNPYANPYGNPYANPYGNPYANPYMNPYGIPYPQQAQPQGDGAPQRPALFGSGKSRPRGEEGEDDGRAQEKAKKFANFVPITPTGMEARSPYKQRDDLRVLWKGAITSSQLGGWSAKDPNIAAALNKIDVGLPAEVTKGSFSVGQRQVDAVFKPVFVDKRVQGQLRKTQSEMVQSYYRYLYSYNRFALAQQTVAARKQEVEVASTHAEQQRAAADLSQAQSEADSSKEDMRSAQMELSAVSGAAAARAIIQKVSGVAPSIESLAQAAPTPEAEPQGGFNVLGFLGFNKKNKEEQPPPPQESPKAAKADAKKQEKAEKAEKSAKSKDKQPKEKTVAQAKKGGKEVAAGDLEPAPAKGDRDSAGEKAEAPAASDGILFELKGKNISARKSVLNVSIRNSSDNAFSFSPEDISVQEGNQKLSEAAMRAEFDSTSIAPNGEVKGTITIFGRPWNDRLTISLSDGQRSIHMKR
ncbi:MAG: hypothetical protein C0507_04160 [Cyanobacteria bacterium PR.3.49]|nr:hypothetical protein [Cyanobacteria bacterium PR.3.49]